MAITELSTLTKAIRSTASSAPSLGCGCDMIADANLHEGDWVAIQTIDHSAGNTTLAATTVVDWTGVTLPLALKNSSAANNGMILYGNFTAIQIDQGKWLAYRRCK